MQRAAFTSREGARTVVVLGTGGTIAGIAASAADNVGYTAARTGVAQLVAGLASGRAVLESEQVAQIDSKDMDFAVWQRLAERIGHHLARPEVAGVVITHGTDTLEETAYFLHRVFAPAKPVVLTGAMRPATSLQSDGPQNLQDSIAIAAGSEASGVLVVMAGTVHAGAEVRKIHPYRLDVFSSGDSGPLARIEEGRVRPLRRWPVGQALGTGILTADTSCWPAVEIVTSCCGVRGLVVQALRAAGVRGIVVAATGNGSVQRELEAALQDAMAGGIAVLRSTRCLDGRIVPGAGAAGRDLPSAEGLTPVQARIEVMLRLMEADAGGALRRPSG